VDLFLTAIGLFPSLGSALKGVGKVIFKAVTGVDVKTVKKLIID